MDDAEPMQKRHPVRDLPGDSQSLQFIGERTAIEHGAQCFTLWRFHHQRVVAIDFASLIGLDQVLMHALTGDPGLNEKPLPEHRRLPEGFHNLDQNASAIAYVVRKVHFTVMAAELLLAVVLAETKWKSARQVGRRNLQCSSVLMSERTTDFPGTPVLPWRSVPTRIQSNRYPQLCVRIFPAFSHL